MTDKVRKERLCLFVAGVDAANYVPFILQRWSVAAGAQSWYVKWDLYQAYNLHKVALCVCQRSDSVRNVRAAVSDLDNVQEIKPN